jgi:hypothetical protein
VLVALLLRATSAGIPENIQTYVAQSQAFIAYFLREINCNRNTTTYGLVNFFISATITFPKLIKLTIMLTTRRPTLADHEAIARLLLIKYHFSSIEAARDAVDGEARHQHIRIAEEADGDILGIIAWRPQGAAYHGVIEVSRLAVLAEQTNPIEIKEILFDAAIAEADLYFRDRDSKLRKVFSLIHADNRHLKTFFAYKGMQQEAVLRSHYRMGVDELVYSMFMA